MISQCRASVEVVIDNMDKFFRHAALDFARHFVRIEQEHHRWFIRSTAGVQKTKLTTKDLAQNQFARWMQQHYETSDFTCLHFSLVDTRHLQQYNQNYFSDDHQLRFKRTRDATAPSASSVYHLLVRDGRDREHQHYYYGGPYMWVKYLKEVQYDEFRPVVSGWLVSCRDALRTNPQLTAPPSATSTTGAPGMSAIRTVYRGVQYRSRLEARYAAMFDYLGLEHHYEQATFRIALPDSRAVQYTPDFWLPSLDAYFEIKPDEAHDEERQRCIQLARYGHRIVLMYGVPGSPFLSERGGRTYQNAHNMQLVTWNRDSEQQQLAWHVDDITNRVSLRANYYQWHERLEEACKHANGMQF